MNVKSVGLRVFLCVCVCVCVAHYDKMSAPAKCTRCGKTAYATEQVKMNDKTFHLKVGSDACSACARSDADWAQQQGARRTGIVAPWEVCCVAPVAATTAFMCIARSRVATCRLEGILRFRISASALWWRWCLAGACLLLTRVDAQCFTCWSCEVRLRCRPECPPFLTRLPDPHRAWCAEGGAGRIPILYGARAQQQQPKLFCFASHRIAGAKCYAANFGPKGFRGGAVDGSTSVTEHKWDTQSHVKDPNYGKVPAAAAPAGGGQKFCSSCGAALPGAAARFCSSCGAGQ